MKTTCATVAIGLGIISSPAIAQYTDDVIRIGFITDMSGLYADVDGPGGAEAIRMAIEDIGGEIEGRKIELVVADHQNKADLASAKAREWFDQLGIDLLIGGTNSSAALAMAGIAAEKKKVFMSVGAGSTRLTNEECNPYTVHYLYNTASMARSSGKAIVDAGGKDWYFITADYTFGHTLEEETAKYVVQNGGTVKGSVRHPLNSADFASFILQAQASGAKILGMANGSVDTVNAIKTAREFGVGDTMTLAALMIEITDIHSMSLEEAQGLYVTTGWYWDRDEETREWAKRFFERRNAMPTMYQAGDYSAASLYLQAVKALGTDDGTKVMRYLKDNKINDLLAKDGVIREDGRMVYDMYLYQVKSPEESKGPWDYLKLVSVVPGEDAYGAASESTCSLMKG